MDFLYIFFYFQLPRFVLFIISFLLLARVHFDFLFLGSLGKSLDD